MIRNIRIGLRTSIAFGILGVITLLLGLFSIAQLSKINEMTDVLTLERIPLIMELGDIRRDVLLTQVRVNELSDAQTPQQVSIIARDINDIAREYDKSEQFVLSMSMPSESKRLFSDIRNLQNQLIEKLSPLYSMTEKGNIAESLKYRDEVIKPLAIEMRKAVDVLSKLERKRAISFNDQATKTYQESRNLLITGIVISITALLIMAYLYTRSLVMPLRQSVVIAQKIAEGDLTQSFSDDSNDEAGDLLTALADMQHRLRDALLMIRDSSHQLAATSEELSAVTNQSSEVVAKQRDEIAQAATAIGQLTIAVDEVARTASSTRDNAQVVDDKTQSGKLKVVQTIKTIEALKSELNASEQGVEDLAVRIDSISSVLDVIREIAEQTNLLALNAAIEAARAGENGRGFAVVADEVRALAHRTQVSTKDIEVMIASISSQTETTVHNMKRSYRSAGETLDVANDAGSAFEEISVLISDINMQNTMIANAAEEQATVSKDVDTNLFHIRDLSVQTSSGAQETNASSIELAKLAEHLNELVVKFRLS